MFYQQGLTGVSLPPKTLCLTYDDGPGFTQGNGPGPHTLEIAQFLNQRGIQATFFTVGKFAAQYPDIVSSLKSRGHLIANHTFDHPQLEDYLVAGGDVANQVALTFGHIEPWVDGSTVFFRPPYASWSPELAQALNDDFAVCLNHVGPILWDIDGGDWACWRNGTTVQECLEGYLKLIRQKGRGIVLLHDSSADQDAVRKANMTYALTELLVPILQQQRYQFVRLDSIAGIRSATQVPFQFALRASNGKYVSPQGDRGGRILVNEPYIGRRETLSVEKLGFGKVAIRTANGLYWSVQDGGGPGTEVLANSPAVGDWEPLDVITVGRGQVAFRTIQGFFLTREHVDGGRLMASVPWIRDWEVFTFVNLSHSGSCGPMPR